MINIGNKPNFFIVGAAKSGTTSLAYYLSQHPDIFFPHRKEPHYFGSDIKRHGNYLTGNLDAYLKLYRNSKSSVLGDASTWYMVSFLAASEIYNFNPFSKILIILRNTVDAIYSWHHHLIYSMKEDILDFGQALEAEAERKLGLRIPESGKDAPQQFFYTEFFRYSSQVKRYLDVFGKNNVHIVIFDDFINNIDVVYNEVLLFLNVSNNFVPRFDILNAKKMYRSRQLNVLFRSLPSKLRFLFNIFFKDSQLSKFKRILMKFNEKPVPNTPMDPAIRSMLQHIMYLDIQSLSNLLNRDLMFWTSN